MATEDGARWDARYADREVDVMAAPPDAIADAEMIDRVPTSGRALDIACGLGSQSIWLAHRGLDVTALDVSPEAIGRVGDAAGRHGVSNQVTALAVDLDDGLPTDLTGFDVIVCQRFRDPSLYPELTERLAPGGLLVITVLSQTGATDPGPFHAPPGELRAAFDVGGCTVLHHDERDGQESIVLRRDR